MSVESIPIFFLSSGRGGSYQIYKFFNNKKNIISNHEYKFEQLLKIGVSYRMSLIKKEEVSSFLKNVYADQIRKNTSSYWVDSSNALPWVIESLIAVFPDAKFVYLTRDGRKVVSSFYNKLEDVMYPEWGVKEFKSFLNSGNNEPDEDKRIWRPLPGYGKDLIPKKTNNRFDLICWYWAELSSEIISKTKFIKDRNFYQLKFEDFVSSKKCRNDLLSWLDLDNKEFDKIDLSRPVNVYQPKNFTFNSSQKSIFKEICEKINHELGYTNDLKDLYDVKY